MRRLTLLTATAVLLLLAGCSSDGDAADSSGTDETATAPSASGASKTPDAPSGPDCDEVWRAGQVLPDTYTSCIADGEEATQDVVECTDGSSLVVYLDTFYAVTGQEIVEPDVAPLQDTEEFGAAYSTCTGE
ncbi:MAG: hypothetical protein ABW075_10215 [Aeromicrobium sp.]